METLNKHMALSISGGTGGEDWNPGYEAGYAVGHWLGTKVGEAIDVTFYLIDGLGSIFD